MPGVLSLLTSLCCSGEGVPDILMLLVQLTQKLMEDKLMYISEVQVSEALKYIYKIDMHQYIIGTNFHTRSSHGSGSEFDRYGSFFFSGSAHRRTCVPCNEFRFFRNRFHMFFSWASRPGYIRTVMHLTEWP